MPITALALLRIPPPSTALRVDPLSDSVLVHTELDFGRAPDELADALLDLLGEDVVYAHDDPRGVLFVPSVATLRARDYEAVIAEVGEGGVWGGLPTVASGVDFGQLFGSMLAQLPPSLMASAQAAATGDRGALDAMGAQVQALLGGVPALSGLAEQLQGLSAQGDPQAAGGAIDRMMESLGVSGEDQLALREQVLGMQQELMRDPSAVEHLTRQLFARDEDKDK